MFDVVLWFGWCLAGVLWWLSREQAVEIIEADAQIKALHLRLVAADRQIRALRAKFEAVGEIKDNVIDLLAHKK